jgi:hypothetical protein
MIFVFADEQSSCSYQGGFQYFSIFFINYNLFVANTDEGIFTMKRITENGIDKVIYEKQLTKEMCMTCIKYDENTVITRSFKDELKLLDLKS